MNKSERDWRIRYSKASSKIRAQIKRLQEKHPESVALERGGLQDWEGLRSLPKDYSLKDIKMRTKLAEQVLSEGWYTLQRFRRSYAQASISLNAKGIRVSPENVGAYFRFLDDLKARRIAVYKPSKWWARMWNKYKKSDMSKEDLQKNIDRWAKEFEKNKRYKPEFSPQSGSDSFADQG